MNDTIIITITMQAPPPCTVQKPEKKLHELTNHSAQDSINVA
jgi:hypothetical protein